MGKNLSLGATIGAMRWQSASSVSEKKKTFEFSSVPDNGQSDIQHHPKGSQEDRTSWVQTKKEPNKLVTPIPGFGITTLSWVGEQGGSQLVSRGVPRVKLGLTSKS